MRPQVKSTILYSVLGLSLALNAALAIGYFGSPAEDGYCLLDRLDLDAGQKQRLAEMRSKMHEKRSAYWRRANAIKNELAEAICAVQADRAVLDDQLARYAQNQAVMQRSVAEHLLGVKAMLHPGQSEAFRTLLRTEMFRGMRSARDTAVGTP